MSIFKGKIDKMRDINRQKQEYARRQSRYNKVRISFISLNATGVTFQSTLEARWTANGTFLNETFDNELDSPMPQQGIRVVGNGSWKYREVGNILVGKF